MKTLISALFGGLLLVACGGSPVAQYVVSTDAIASITKGANGDCPSADPSNVVDTGTIGHDQLISIYQLSDGTIYADVTIPTALSDETTPGTSGEHVLSGTQSGNTYSLQDSSSTDQKSPEGQPSSEEKTNDTLSLSLTLDGDAVTGKLSQEASFSCTGAACPNTAATDCIYSVNVNGRKLPVQGNQVFEPTPGQAN